MSHLCDQVTGWPALSRTTSADSSPLCTSKIEFKLTCLLNGRYVLSVYHDHKIVAARRGDTKEAMIYALRKVKMPIMNIWNIITLQIRRVKVIGHAWP